LCDKEEGAVGKGLDMDVVAVEELEEVEFR